MQLLFSKDARVTKFPTVTHTSLQEINNSLPIVGDRYTTTRTRDAVASLIMTIQAFDPPSYWYNLSSNNNGSLCQLLLLEESIFLIYFNKMWTYSSKSCLRRNDYDNS